MVGTIVPFEVGQCYMYEFEFRGVYYIHIVISLGTHHQRDNSTLMIYFNKNSERFRKTEPNLE